MTTLLVGSYVLLWCLVLVLAATVLFLGRQVGSIYQRLGPVGARISNPGPELDSLIEPTALQDIDGEEIAIGGSGERRMLLVFLSPGCDGCEKLASGCTPFCERAKHSEPAWCTAGHYVCTLALVGGPCSPCLSLGYRLGFSP